MSDYATRGVCKCYLRRGIRYEEATDMSKSKKKKKSWFEALCTMDDAPRQTAAKKKVSRPSAKTAERVRVQSKADDPFEDLPPFDDGETVVTPVHEGSYEETGESTRTSGAKGGKSARTSSKGGRTSAKSGDKKGKKNDKPLPAEIAYRMQPYLTLGFGALMAVMLLLSLLMSGGSFDWSTSTHPFRWVGYQVERLLFGLIGYGAFLLPLAMIYLSIDRIREGSSYRSQGRGLLSCGVLVLLPAIIHTCMITEGGELDTWSVGELFRLGADKLGGGAMAGLLGRLCYVALGVIGTLIVGGLLLIILLMLIFRVTPRMLWNRLRDWREERAERLRAYRLQDERDEEERRRRDGRSRGDNKKVRASDQKVVVYDPHANDRDDEPDDRTDDEESDEEPLRRHGRHDDPTPATDDDGDYLDPTRALLEQESKRGKKNKAPKSETPDDGDPSELFEDDDSSPIDTVEDLSQEDIDEMERQYNSVAQPLPEEEESDDDRDGGSPVFYPDHAEIDLDEEDNVSPLETPIDDEPPLDDEPEKTVDYCGDFDYTMESTDNDDVVDGTEIIGGVEVKIDRLSDEERERGETFAEDEEDDEPVRRPYTYPTVDLLIEPKPHSATKDQEIRAKMQRLHTTLTNFKVRIESMSYVCGPSVTRYEVRPAPGVRVRAIANLADDIAMSLAAESIRIEAPIPGKEAVGIEVPNSTRETVFLRRLIDSDDFRNRPSKLTASLGEDVAGNPIVIDLVKMPHLLVAGTTGSGKSVCINDFIISLLYKSSPEEVKIILIDPKQVEFTVYKDMPHLMAPIVCEPKRAAAALNLAVLEMEKRFQMIREVGVRDIAGYNAITENDRYEHPYMPHIVIIIDELADLMMQARDEVEASIVRIAQKARAAGMHLVIGTQRPSVDVITGLIKANVPSRIACTVVSQVDSRTILDTVGAEKLLGRGDMLYAPVGSPKPLRVQGAFVSDGEVEAVVEFIKRNNDPVRYNQEFLDNLDREAAMIGTKRSADDDMDMDEGEGDGHDPKFYEALRIAVDNNRISTSLLQRMLSIGYGRAAKIIDDMERQGFVGPAVGNKPREIRLTKEAYAELIMNKPD